MLKVGLTGGMGSGKTTVARIFKALGIPVYDADTAAKRLMEEDPVLKAEILRNFGSESYSDGRLNRRWLAEHVFSDPQRTAKINALVHPATIADAKAWMLQQQTAYAIKEAALIFESGSEKDLDLIIGVSADEPTRIRRIMARDGSDEAHARQRMQRQLDEHEKISRCHRVILNNDDSRLLPQVLALHEEICTMQAATPDS